MAPLTPEQVAVIERVWLATANAAEAARQAKCSEASARRYIVRARLKDADGLYAQALDEAEQDHLDLVAKARGKIDAALDGDKPDVAELARAANDSLRAVTATKMAHAKLTGRIVDKHEHAGPGGTPLTIFAPAEVEP